MARLLRFTATIVVCALAASLAAAHQGGSCGQNCTSSDQCTGGEYGYCKRCDVTRHICVSEFGTCPAVGCSGNGECLVWAAGDASCLCQAWNNNGVVNMCRDSLSGYCGTTCRDKSDCSGASTCTECVAGTCQAGSCGNVEQCNSNTECSDPISHTCACAQATQSSPFTCQNPMGEWCGTRCGADADCPTKDSYGRALRCTTCSQGQCRARACGAPCTDDSQCTGTDRNAFPCNTCREGRCQIARGACGASCTEDAECTSASCSVCGNSTGSGRTCTAPTPPGCLQSCSTHDDCSMNPTCNYCPAMGQGCTTYETGVTKGPAPGSDEYILLVRHQRRLVADGVLKPVRPELARR